MAMRDDWEDDEEDYGYVLPQYGIYCGVMRTSCIEAERWAAREGEPHTQKVYPVEHGTECQGHWQHAYSDYQTTTPHVWFIDNNLPERYGRSAVILDVKEEYL
jgi:hypothetical protein